MVAGLGFTACEEQVVEVPAIIRPVRYREVMARSGGRERTFTGAAKAGVEAKISFRVGGTIQELELNVGDRVRPGDLIARLDPRDYELQVEDAEASLAQARAQAVRAQADFARSRGLYERDNASQADYDAARAARDSAEANVRSIEKKLETARLQLSYTTLRSPIDGAVAQTPVEVNENVQPGTPVVILNAGARPEVEVGIPEVLIRDIQQGAPATARFDAIPNRRFTGHITEVGVSATPGMTTYPVTVELSQLDSRLLPGMAGEVTFYFGDDGSAARYVVPSHAVVQDRDGRFLFVVSGEADGLGVVERRAVVTGRLIGSGLEVLEGLQGGEKVVVTGANRVQDGQQVRVSVEHES
jgi:RND family efflux transporter MFP subunit